MKNYIPIALEDVQKHLKCRGSAIGLDEDMFPGVLFELECFKSTLENQDMNRLILWHEFSEHTRETPAKLTKLLPTARELQRVRSFIHGDPSQGLSALDLSKSDDMEMVLVTDCRHQGSLHIIDGNHRAISHYITNRSFENISVYFCEHPYLKDWPFIRPKQI